MQVPCRQGRTGLLLQSDSPLEADRVLEATKQNAKRIADQDREVPSLGTLARDRRPLLASVVAERIREAIIFGELTLGESVSEDRLATTLGVSRTPVREALTALQLQGLVEIEPQRGSFVFQPTAQDVEELCAFRSLLELDALRLACTHERAKTLHMLRGLEADMEAAEKAGNNRAAARADAAFHEAFFANCGNRFLVQSYTMISGQIGAMRYFARESRKSRRRPSTEHRAIIKALTNSDLTAAASILKAHIAEMPNRFRETAQAQATIK